MKKNTFFYIVVLLSSFAIWTSCNKDEVTDCLPSMSCSKGLKYYAEDAVNENWLIDCTNCTIDCHEIYSDVIRYDYFFPVFNPNNNNEIAYLRFDNSVWGIDYELWVFNLCSGTQRKLSDNALYSLSWSIKDWLIYTGSDQQIWKIKSNGDSLTQLTSSGDYNRSPKWNPKGDKYLYNTKTGSIGWYIIADENGIPLDTLEEMAGAGSYNWIDDQKISFLVGTPSSTSKLQYLDLTGYYVTPILEMERGMYNDSLVRSTDGFITENSIVWSAIRVIGKTDISTGATTFLKSGYSNRRYSYIDVSGDQSKFLFARQDINPVVNCRYDSEYRIYIMDTDGSNEQKINIPEPE